MPTMLTGQVGPARLRRAISAMFILVAFVTACAPSAPAAAPTQAPAPAATKPAATSQPAAVASASPAVAKPESPVAAPSPIIAASPAVAPASPAAASSPAVAASPVAAASQAPDPSVNLRVAFVEFQTPQNDAWVRANEDGEQYMHKLLPNVDMKVVESVDDSDPKSATVFRQLAQDGYQVIFANGFGYQQVIPDVAKDFPNVIFIQQEANVTGTNYGSYWGRIEEPRYVQGVLAGKQTKSNKIGFIGGFPVPPVISGANAMYLGLKATNPNATFQVLWPNSWYDPPKEKEATDALINGGVDIVAYHGDDATTLQEAAQKGKWGMTSNADFTSSAPEAFLTGSVWNWGPYYTRTIKAVANHTWKPEFYMGDMADGTVGLAPYGSSVTPEAKQAAEQAKADIISGKIKVFQGPITDQSGKVQIPAGQTATDQQIDSMGWLVQGIIGSAQ